MLEKDIYPQIAAELKVQPHQVEAAAKLLDEGNTVPFIARYRKEATGLLEDEQLRELEERLAYLRGLVKRQEEILAKIEEQGKLTVDLRRAIEKTRQLQELEDLYLPYKQKKRTRAQIARERGLEPLANRMLLASDQKGSPEAIAAAFCQEDKDVATAEDALQGAMDIVAETVMEESKVRQSMREHIAKTGILQTELAKDAPEESQQVFRMYEAYEEPVHRLPPHRILAINRGEKLGCLKVTLATDHEENCRRIERQLHRAQSIWTKYLQLAIEDGYKRLLLPSLTREIRTALIQDNHLKDVHYLITNEAGASVYSASKLAKEELPEYDVVIRGAVSIARRVQDPLAELVKIDPQAIGVGQYQHDVNQKELASTLDATIESAVNHVGVDLNTASAALLRHIAGINATTAKNIIAYRNEHGVFTSRRELLKVPRLGPAAFTQCAGFLRIHGAKSPLDNTPVHPESYALAEKILQKLGFTLQDLRDPKQLERMKLKRRLLDERKERELAAALQAGTPTVHDILDALVSPGRDPRADLPAPLTRQAIVKLSELKPGTILRGTVRNITDFGAFVDIGLHEDGLIHISELAKRRVKHPLEVVSIGQVLRVMVISVDEKRGRIGLSLKRVPEEVSV